MTKQEFLDALCAGLSGVTESDASERIAFYREMIDDRIEEGLSEQDAVAQIGDVQQIIDSILVDIPQKKAKKGTEKAPKKGVNGRQILFLCLGAPLWLPLLITAFALLISLLAVLWSRVACLWSVFASLAGVGLGCTLGGVVYALFSSAAGGIAALGAGLISAGLAIPAFYGCVAATKGGAWLTKTVCVAVVKFLFGRGRTE